ncbi:hypothetical protein POPTR_003G083500v4 [Populus trichocarpa]|uniref:Uncharacterized protein n=2 Tax=Populus trichocarpa TaxID=3694 RepID=A0ACC0T8M2_POPTR|nr:light-harvesting complex-like protein 3 isotype 1, chloroplastic [Populus trichocarpa]XP_024452226.1 light-harvesting complex-like protein 3 isotype 1, chloroplastic [Populus trichocarpa]KAI5594444.1 hypothetical protein BDE02_03G073400 [Populus trichocarpa]KAI5594445.1 hypothetical protein BDE02_03G073400 [Populus trichocarpa]KAI9397817.1 hypothetical protein POPTR_003G083500v4 [Populus trichocarpa]PNT44370.1 hypothetical protein POPTR_003G083500v4 [Populus trichocarpa]|eukprot:XP_006385565.1 light-harvesting complex-like protein 3 isotype 1, chloroplastic [Populus trichocarpa]
MSISMSLFSPPLTRFPPSKPHFTYKSTLSLGPTNRPFLLSTPKASTDNGGAGVSASAATVEEPKLEQKTPESSDSVPVAKNSSNGAVAAGGEEKVEVSKFGDPRWISGTWDLKQFQKDGKTDWDAVIDAEARRRKWLQCNPESSSNNDPVVFDTSIIPWWTWMKRFHLPEAELLNGRAAMIGFFMAYLVDSLTGVGLVDQMSNFFCKTLLFVAVVGVLLIRKNEDLETIKKLLEETTFYDKQWQATWQDEKSTSPKDD